MKDDKIFQAFLAKEKRAAAELSAASSLVKVAPAYPGLELPQHYLAEFFCKGLVMSKSGKVSEASYFRVGMFFPSHYLRCGGNSIESLVWMEPVALWHPNINPPAICAGNALMSRSPGVTELIYQLHQMITWQKWSAKDALYAPAAAWARRNQHRLPIDRRPLKGGELNIELDAPDTEERGAA